MDDIVKQALRKWPNVPCCYGWLGLDARGQWFMRDERAQSLGPFVGGPQQSKGSRLSQDKLIQFIHRNYEPDPQGQWYFQNGPQRVYVELEATPLIWRLDDDFRIEDHMGRSAQFQRCYVDEPGRVYLKTDLGFGLVDSSDMGRMADAIERNHWVPEVLNATELPWQFGYEPSPQRRAAAKPCASPTES